MTDEATEARQLLSVLRERPVSVDPERTAARRARVLPGVRHTVERLARRHSRNRAVRTAALGALSAAAAAALVGVAASWLEDPQATATATPAEVRMVQGRMLHRDASGLERTVLTGDSLPMPVAGELTAAEGASARLETSTGLALSVVGEARVSLSGMNPKEAERHVLLLQGELSCDVPKLDRGARFAVVTPNARAVVHGTRFTVTVDSAEEGVTRTCVRVDEGHVAVHHAGGSISLRRGEDWGCDPPASALEPKSDGDGAVKQGSRPPPRARQTVPRANGTLAAETRLLQSALAAERTGQPDLAKRRLQALLSRYPDSPLAPEAHQALDRLSGRGTEGRE